MGCSETDILTAKKNLKALMDLPGTCIDRAAERRALNKSNCDMDSSGRQTCARQGCSA